MLMVQHKNPYASGGDGVGGPCIMKKYLYGRGGEGVWRQSVRLGAGGFGGIYSNQNDSKMI